MTPEPPPPRLACPRDLGGVIALVEAAYAPYVPRIGQRPGPMGDDYAGRIADGQAWVMEAGDGLVGLVVLEEGPGALLLDNIAVAPAAQGQGIGRRLMRFAEAEASRRGRTALRLYTHVLMTENIALYGRLGFIETGRSREHGFDRVFMVKPLG